MATQKVIELVLRARDAASGAVTAVTTSLRGLDNAQDAVVSNTPAMANALSRLGTAARGARAAVSSGNGFLGLQPYQLQNLSFQINDLVTQIASGTSASQAFAQQAGQIAQIFPRLIAGAVRLAPLLAAVGVAVGIVATAFARAHREVQRFDKATGESAAQARGPWSEAFRELSNTFSDLVDVVQGSGLVEETDRIFTQMGRGARRLTGFIRDLVHETRFFFSFLADGREAAEEFEDAAGAAKPRGRGGPSAESVGTNAEVDARIKEARRREAERAEREAERAAARAAAAHEAFRQHLSDLEFEATLIGLSANEQEIKTALREAELEAQAAGLELSQQEFAALHQRILLLQEARQAEADFEAEMAEHIEAQRKAQELSQRAAEDSARSVERLNESIAGGLTNAIDGVIAGTKSWEDAFREFAADFLRQIARMIIQQIILNALQNSNPYAAGAAFVAGAAGFHSGGIAGEARPQRRVSPGLFANAVRYHNGGMAGLRPGEVPAILKRNEEVLTEDNPRHAFNGGGAQRTPDLKIVNLIDAGELASQMLGTRKGEESFMNFIGANRTTIRGILG